jgi:hypothetical protein
VFVKDKCGQCKEKLKTNLQFKILSKTGYSFVPNLAGIEGKLKLDNCRKISREDVSMPVGAV